jgi:prefoldin alpha subunit
MSGSPPSAEQQVQEDLVRLDAYRGQLNAMVQQLQYLSASRSDHLRAREALEGLERTGADGEVLVPLGGDAFVRARPEKDAPVFLGIGSGIVVELDRGKVTEILAERLAKIDQASKELEGQVRSLDDRVQVLSRRLDAMTQGPPERAAIPVGDVGSD